MTNNIKNILIIGKTGSGKSTLANVITGTNKFKEGKYSTSETKEIQIEETEIDGIRYLVIDTVGIGDTEIPTWEVLYKLAKMSNSVKDGLSQILLLTGNVEFTEDAKETYKLLEKFFFDTDISKYTTIVRTHFPGFRNQQNYEEEKQKMLEVNEEFREVIEKVSGIVYVDNPPVSTGDLDEEAMNGKRRKYSGDILKNRLRIIFQDTENNEYKPINLGKLNEEISPYIDESREKNQKKTKLRTIKAKVVKKTLQYILTIDPDFSKKEEVQSQLWQIENEEMKDVSFEISC
jgi:energy-coupling factor transporter ATP-binding protein EcfA2